MVENLLQIVFGLSKDVSNVRCFICLFISFYTLLFKQRSYKRKLTLSLFLSVQWKAKAFPFLSLFVFYFIFIFFSFFLEYIYMKRGMTFRVK